MFGSIRAMSAAERQKDHRLREANEIRSPRDIPNTSREAQIRVSCRQMTKTRRDVGRRTREASS